MATNPMQKKARNSLITGVLVTTLIMGAALALVYMQVLKKDKENAELKAKLDQKIETVEVYTINQSVESGQIITSDMIGKTQVNVTAVPTNAIRVGEGIFETYTLHDTQGNQLYSDTSGMYIEELNGSETRRVTIEYDAELDKYYKSGIRQYYDTTIPSNQITQENGKLYITENGQKVEIFIDDKLEKYYKIGSLQREYIELLEVPYVSKVKLEANNILTDELVAISDEITTADRRIQEYNVINLPSHLNIGDYIDIRLMLPSSRDYIVVAKKRILNMTEDTIWINMSEEEILSLNCAIVESYTVLGSKLYANTYVEAGVQEKAITTYPLTYEILSLVQEDPNIISRAKTALLKRYQDEQALVDERNNINTEKQPYLEDATTSIESGVKEDVKKSEEERTKYIEELQAAEEEAAAQAAALQATTSK